MGQRRCTRGLAGGVWGGKLEATGLWGPAVRLSVLPGGHRAAARGCSPLSPLTSPTLPRSPGWFGPGELPPRRAGAGFRCCARPRWVGSGDCWGWGWGWGATRENRRVLLLPDPSPSTAPPGSAEKSPQRERSLLHPRAACACRAGARPSTSFHPFRLFLPLAQATREKSHCTSTSWPHTDATSLARLHSLQDVLQKLHPKQDVSNIVTGVSICLFRLIIAAGMATGRLRLVAGWISCPHHAAAAGG